MNITNKFVCLEYFAKSVVIVFIIYIFHAGFISLVKNVILRYCRFNTDCKILKTLFLKDVYRNITKFSSSNIS